jgi:hypothetical protein
MAWGKAGSADGTNAESFDTGTFTTSKFLTFMSYVERTSDSNNTEFRMGYSSIDTGSNYARRRSADGGGDDTTINQDGINLRTASTNESFFGYIVNISGEEKLVIMYQVIQNTAGSANAPYRGEFVGKWVNTSNQADVLGFYSGGTNTLSDYSNLSVLGSDMTPSSASSATISDGAIFYETDTNISYVLYNGSWTAL